VRLGFGLCTGPLFAQLPGGRPIEVAFADVVEFTRLGEEVPPEELGEVAARLASLTRDVVAEPVHFVKTIGGAVMLVSADAER
jgi:adenylate cyclase